jgi:hypothetical protein
VNSLTALLAAEHLQDLLREAESVRRSRRGAAVEAKGPAAWRRSLGRVARGLSVALDRIATRLDPEIRRARSAAA